MASDTLEQKIEQVKVEWENVKKKAESKLKASGYVLTEQGQSFLTRRPDSYIVINTENKDFEVLRHQVLCSNDSENALVKLTMSLINEPLLLGDGVQLMQKNEDYKNAFTVLSENNFAVVEHDLFGKLQNYSSMNQNCDSLLLEYNLIYKAIK